MLIIAFLPQQHQFAQKMNGEKRSGKYLVTLVTANGECFQIDANNPKIVHEMGLLCNPTNPSPDDVKKSGAYYIHPMPIRLEQDGQDPLDEKIVRAIVTWLMTDTYPHKWLTMDAYQEHKRHWDLFGLHDDRFKANHSCYMDFMFTNSKVFLKFEQMQFPYTHPETRNREQKVVWTAFVVHEKLTGHYLCVLDNTPLVSMIRTPLKDDEIDLACTLVLSFGWEGGLVLRSNTHLPMREVLTPTPALFPRNFIRPSVFSPIDWIATVSESHDNAAARKIGGFCDFVCPAGFCSWQTRNRFLHSLFGEQLPKTVVVLAKGSPYFICLVLKQGKKHYESIPGSELLGWTMSEVLTNDNVTRLAEAYLERLEKIEKDIKRKQAGPSPAELEAAQLAARNTIRAFGRANEEESRDDSEGEASDGEIQRIKRRALFLVE